MQDSYHNPVLSSEVLQYLLSGRDGTYVDGTLGGGGHAQEILQRLDASGFYIGIDRDEEALAYARERLKPFPNVFFFHGRFSRLAEAVRQSGKGPVDGVLLDLGVSSHQIDAPLRGFSFMAEADLDMRMDRGETLTARDILNSYDEKKLAEIFRRYGEERQAGRIAHRVVKFRRERELDEAGQLRGIIDSCVPARFAVKSYARIFQALRIEVNRELEELEAGLEQAGEALKPGGRLAVISYHSLEDRIVKTFLKKMEHPCECPPELPVCVCGKKARMKRIKPYLIRPAAEEIRRNSRARSARMRVGEKLS